MLWLSLYTYALFVTIVQILHTKNDTGQQTFLILVTISVARIRYMIFILTYSARHEPSLHVEDGVRIKIRYQF